MELVRYFMGNIVYEGFEQGFGEEYPAAITVLGTRLPLWYETRFLRHFRTVEPWLPHELETVISRFVDGSASVTLQQLEAEWATWTELDRMDLCSSIDDLQLLEQPDLPAVVRFIVYHASPEELSGVAPSVGRIFPAGESFKLLLVALQNSRVGITSNIIQGIALTKHSEAEATLRRHLQSIWAEASLWEDASFVNRMAYDALTCIRSLIQLGASPGDFEVFVRKLSEHACRRIREQCQKSFAKHYSWLNEPEDNAQA